MILTIPGRLSMEVPDFAAASAAYANARDESGEGGSTFPEGKLTGTGLYRVSYNARIWDGTHPWRPGDTPLYVPA